MDLTKQPPRRPSNIGMTGMINLARMADKGRAHNDETMGEFVYGEDSRLDREVLEFVHMTADEFAGAAAGMDDEELSELVLEKAQRSQTEIEAFNRKHLEHEPQDELHKRLLKERVEKLAPGRTDIKTTFASIELDDRGAFRDTDLTSRPPRTPYLRTVAGVVGVARMGDKARAFKAGLLGEYKYGNASGVDETILNFLGISEEDFAEAAYENPNDIELGEWVKGRTERTPAEICAFNATLSSRGRSGPSRERFLQRRAEICPECTWVETWFDLIDVDDEKGFGLVDLARHAARSSYDTGVGGVTGLARMIDKGRAYNSDTLGDYWYGEDSGADKGVLEFLGMSAAEFTEGLKENGTDDEVVAWLGENLKKGEEEIAAFNQKLQTVGPANDQQREIMRGMVAKLDSTRKDISSWYAMMQLEDQITFARLKAGV